MGVGLAAINVFCAQLVMRTENDANIGKLILLGVFGIVGLCTPMEWPRLAPEQYARAGVLVCGAMVILSITKALSGS